MNQKFFKGDHVFIGDMPQYMSHFSNNCEAIVLHSYAEQYSDSEARYCKKFCVYLLPDGGQSAWYEENQFKLLGEDRFDLLPKNNIHRVNWENKKVRGIQ
jgi:hypothetical protein